MSKGKWKAIYFQSSMSGLEGGRQKSAIVK